MQIIQTAVAVPTSWARLFPAGCTDICSYDSRRSPTGRAVCFTFINQPHAAAFAQDWAAAGVRPSLRRAGTSWEVALPVHTWGQPFRHLF